MYPHPPKARPGAAWWLILGSLLLVVGELLRVFAPDWWLLWLVL